jgi:hypothetical protein
MKKIKKKMNKNISGGPEKARILINHWRWLESQGPSYKQQATSCKQQAASLTRKHYNDIVSHKLKEKVK